MEANTPRQHIVEPEWLAAHLGSPNLVIADCRFALADPSLGRTQYEAGHIPGAQYFDLDKDLSSPITEHGGRHPLPDPQALEAKLRKAGVSHDSLVVAYDDQYSGMAARLWWLLRYYGHEQVKILNGTFSGWAAAGYPTTKEVRKPPAGSLQANLQPQLLATVDDVHRNLETHRAVLLDAREPIRYQGLQEPIDPVAGRIPGARNAFWRDTSDEQGRWHCRSLAETVADLPKDHPLVVYCGSGVTACPVVLGLSELGYTHVKLYAGSWSDWITYPAFPLDTDAEPANPRPEATTGEN